MKCFCLDCTNGLITFFPVYLFIHLARWFHQLQFAMLIKSCNGILFSNNKKHTIVNKFPVIVLLLFSLVARILSTKKMVLIGSFIGHKKVLMLHILPPFCKKFNTSTVANELNLWPPYVTSHPFPFLFATVGDTAQSRASLSQYQCTHTWTA